MLEVEGLRVAHGAAETVRDVSLTVGNGEAVALIGANGAGKSTVLRALSGLITATASRIDLDGRSLLGLAAERRARAGLAFVPAERHLFGGLSVRVNLELGGHTRGPDRDRLDRVLTLFPRLADRYRQLAGTLSGGEQQMLAIGRALMSAPRVLALDEPSAGLAPALAEEAYAALDRLRAEAGTGLLIAEQQVARVLDLADRAYVLAEGRVERTGPASALARDPSIRRAYLGVG
jgi:branched-chain amino acid transport system ATP-binding protein